jgi:hypothetical protein
MNDTETTRLIHAVLDGEASLDEQAALERALAADPRLRAEFDGLRRMFVVLDAMPRYVPPSDFAERVLALQRSMAAGDPSRQPFSQSGVIGSSGKDIGVRNPSVNANKPRATSESIWGAWQMAMSKRGMWIVGGVAAAIAAMFIGGVVEFPPTGDKATGTIAPAKKAKGEQPGADDLKRRQVDTDDNLRRGKSESGQAGGSPGGAAGGVGGSAGGVGGSAGGVGGSAGGVGGSSSGDLGAAASGGGRGVTAGGDLGSAAGGGGKGAGSSDLGSAAGGGGKGAGSSDLGSAAAGGGRGVTAGGELGSAAAGGGRGVTAGGDLGSAAGGGGKGAGSSDLGSAAGGGGKGAAAGGGGKGGAGVTVGGSSGAETGAAEARSNKK